jgi:hypothetical protein
MVLAVVMQSVLSQAISTILDLVRDGHLYGDLGLTDPGVGTGTTALAVLDSRVIGRHEYCRYARIDHDISASRIGSSSARCGRPRHHHDDDTDAFSSASAVASNRSLLTTTFRSGSAPSATCLTTWSVRAWCATSPSSE